MIRPMTFTLANNHLLYLHHLILLLHRAELGVGSPAARYDVTEYPVAFVVVSMEITPQNNISLIEFRTCSMAAGGSFGRHAALRIGL